MAYETVLYEVSDGVAWITMNRPSVLNALDATLAEEIAAATREAAGDASVRCLVLTGAGRAFSAGADLTQIEPYYQRGEAPPVGRILRERYNPMILPLLALEKPVVAMINGIAAGAGASLALACDVRVASENAKLYQAFVKIGLIPDSGATYFLPRLVGVAKALELAMLGDVVDAHDALRLGLVTKVVPADKLADETRDLAVRLAQMPTRALGLIKRAVHFGATHDLMTAMDYEADLQEILARTADHVEGVKAFLGKREPRFEGR